MQLYQTHVQYLVYYYSSIENLMMKHVKIYPHTMLSQMMLQSVLNRVANDVLC